VSILGRFRRGHGKRAGFTAAAILLTLAGSAPGASTGHCEAHIVDPMAMHHEGHHLATGAIEAPAHRSCQHCHPAQCAALAPCGNSLSMGLADSDPHAADPAGRSGTPLPGLLPVLPSPSYKPPIPPPRSHV